MKPKSNRPKMLWSQKDPPDSVNEYFDTYMGEFGTDWIKSRYPYRGSPKDAFRRSLKPHLGDGFERFPDNGIGCWCLRYDDILNDRTADLLAAAEWLGGQFSTSGSSAMPGGIGADFGSVWVAVLDGGVGVEVLMWEHQRTNRVQARQCTTVRGARAYRCLLELLGFDWVSTKLPGETKVPAREEIRQLVDDLLSQRCAAVGIVEGQS